MVRKKQERKFKIYFETPPNCFIKKFIIEFAGYRETFFKFIIFAKFLRKFQNKIAAIFLIILCEVCFARLSI